MPAGQLLPARQQVVEMTAPPRGILTAAQAARLRRIKDALDPPTKAGGSLRFRLPDRLQNAEHVPCVDLCDWKQTERCRIVP